MKVFKRIGVAALLVAMVAIVIMLAQEVQAKKRLDQSLVPAEASPGTVGEFLTGVHPLVSLQDDSRALSGEFRGGFLTGTSGDIQQERRVSFSWENQNDYGRISICDLPSFQVRFLVMEELEVPQVKFSWEFGRAGSSHWHKYIDYVVIEGRREHLAITWIQPIVSEEPL